jgi:hypothetical protein
MPSRYDHVSHVVHVSAGMDAVCEHCDVWPARARFASTVNHYLFEHGYRLLHVGSECGSIAQETGVATVAVLGK